MVSEIFMVGIVFILEVKFGFKIIKFSNKVYSFGKRD